MKGSVFFEFMRNKNIELKECEIKNVQIDSRKVGVGDLFFAIRGGNDFVEDALLKGASFVIYDSENINCTSEKAVKCSDTVTFLQEMASFYRKKMDPIVIAITGSNGKTTTKDILYSIMSKKYKGKKTEGNYNNHIGMPYTIMQLEEDDKFIILEMGMSGFGEIDLLAKIAEPDYGIITNIGHSHLEHLKTRENIFKAKTELVPYVKNKMIFCNEDEFLKKCEGIKAGKNGEVTAEEIRCSEEGSEYVLNIFGKKYPVKTNLTGEHNVINETMAAAVAKFCEIEDTIIVEALKSVEISKMRFQKIEKNDIIYINDAYNASPMSMKAALESFAGMYKEITRIVVLADMLELGEESEKLHIALSEPLKNGGFDYIFLFGEKMKSLNKVMGNESKHYGDKIEIINAINQIKGKKVVLLKGSRGMKLEEIIK